MSASVDGGLEQGWVASQAGSDASSSEWDEFAKDGAHAWLGVVLMLASAAVSVRGIYWVAATAIRLAH